jgi:hypothetical protein
MYITVPRRSFILLTIPTWLQELSLDVLPLVMEQWPLALLISNTNKVTGKNKCFVLKQATMDGMFLSCVNRRKEVYRMRHAHQHLDGCLAGGRLESFP